MNDEYMIFTMVEDSWVQHSNPIDTIEETREYCRIFFTEKAHYLIVKIIEHK